MSDLTAPPGAERGPNWTALLIAVGLWGLGALVAWDADNIRPGAAAYSRIGPAVFPYGIAAGLAILGLLTAADALRPRVAEPSPPKDALAPGAWIAGGLVAQILLLPVAGFSVATGAVFAATARAFGRGPLFVTYPLGVAFSLLVWLFFSRGLRLVLPAGPLERLF